MRMLVVGTVTAVLAGALSDSGPFSREAAAQAAATRPLVTPAEYERWQVELSNWGRWGKDDEMGTLNLITAAKRKAAAALVREGFTVSLASNASTEKGPGVPCPVARGLLALGSAVTGEDYYNGPRTLRSLPLDRLSREQMRTLLQDGL